MTLPDDARIGRESKDALDCFTEYVSLENRSRNGYGVFIGDLGKQGALSKRLWHDLPNFDVPPTIDARPDTEYILPATDTQHRTAYLFTRFCKLIANNG